MEIQEYTNGRGSKFGSICETEKKNGTTEQKKEKTKSDSLEGNRKKESAFTKYRRYMILKQKKTKCCGDEFKRKEAASARKKRKEKIREKKILKHGRREKSCKESRKFICRFK
jgi:hypothetical protein